MSFHKSTIIETAQKLAQKGQYDKAIKEWEKLIAETPNDGNVYNSIGDLHLKAGHKEKATEVFIKAADAFQSAGFEMKSIAVYKKALKVDPSRVEIHEKLARVYAERGLVGNAIDDYLIAAKHYLKQNNFNASLAVYRKIADLDSKNSDIFIEIAEMCQEQGHKEEALEEYKKAVIRLEETDRTDEAQAIENKILKLDPSYSREASSSGLNPDQEPSSEARGLESDARFEPTALQSASFESVLPENEASGLLEPEPEVMTNEQTVYSSERSLRGKQSIEEDATRGNPDKPIESYLTEAEVYAQYGLLEKAIHQLNLASERFPNHAQPRLKLKALYHQLGDLEKAIEQCSVLSKIYEDIGDEEKRQAVLDELMLISAQSKEEHLEAQEAPSQAALQEEAFLDDLEAPRSTDHDDKNPALFDEEELSFGDETTLLSNGQGSLQDEAPGTAHKESSRLNDQNPRTLDEEIQDLDFSSDVFEADDFPLKDESPQTSPAKAPDAFGIPGDGFDDAFQEILGTGEAQRSSIAEDESLLTTLDETTRVSDAEQTADSNVQPIKNVVSDAKDTQKKSPQNQNSTKEEYVDLQAIISEDLKEEENETTLEKTIRGIQGKAQEDNAAQEIETQYDLGIAYKEMEMIPEAISAFEAAAQGEHRFKDAMTMLVICHRRNGSIDAAIHALQKALKNQNRDQETLIALQYELALLQDQQGHKKEAAHLFDEIFKIDPNFREVASKRSTLTEETLGSTWPGLPEKEISKGDGSPKKKDRVSYL